MRRRMRGPIARGCIAAAVIALAACASPSAPGRSGVVLRPSAPGAVPAGRGPSAAPAPPGFETRTLSVKASAYNSVRSQTDRDPTLTAFGERLRPGMRTIAVSRDLEALGLSHGTRVRIDELPGEWRVADRMSRRHSGAIDLYFGTDVRAAREWGRRSVTIRWNHPLEDIAEGE